MRLSSILQFIFDFEKDSEAEAKMATSFAPAATAASNPYKKALHNMNKSHIFLLTVYNVLFRTKKCLL